MLRNSVLVLVLIFLALQFLLLNRAKAEYRVYRLVVKYDQSQPEQEVLSTLDDIQYMTYYRLTPTQTVAIKNHWMCPGRTDGFKPYCPQPLNRFPAQSPAMVRMPANIPQQAPAPVLQ